MGRYYRLAKTITEQMASEILQEIQEMEQVEKAEFLEDNSKILVKTKEEDYPAVMTKSSIFSGVSEMDAISPLPVLNIRNRHKEKSPGRADRPPGDFSASEWGCCIPY